MALDQWAQIAEIVGAAAVVITLLYLATQIKQANVIARTQARQAWMQLAQGELHKIVDHPSVFHAFTAAEVSDDDKVRLQEWLLSSLRQREFEWFQYKDDVIDEAHFRAYATVISVILGTERTRRFWAHSRYQFDPGFAAFVDEMLAETALSTFFDLDAW